MSIIIFHKLHYISFPKMYGGISPSWWYQWPNLQALAHCPTGGNCKTNWIMGSNAEMHFQSLTISVGWSSISICTCYTPIFRAGWRVQFPFLKFQMLQSSSLLHTYIHTI